MPKPDDGKALKKSVDVIEDHHDRLEDLVGKMDKSIEQLSKAAGGKEVDSGEVERQVKDLNKQMDALRDVMKKLDRATAEVTKNIN